MVEGPHEGGKPAQTVKAKATLARVDDLTQSLGFLEIGLLETGGERKRSRGARYPILLGQTHRDHVSGFAAFDQAQSAVVDEAAHNAARGPAGEASSTGEPGNGKAEAELPFEPIVAQKMRMDGAVDDGEAQRRDEKILELFPNEFAVETFVFHGSGPEHAGAGRRAAKGDLGRLRQKEKLTADS